MSDETRNYSVAAKSTYDAERAITTLTTIMDYNYQYPMSISMTSEAEFDARSKGLMDNIHVNSYFFSHLPSCLPMILHKALFPT